MGVAPALNRQDAILADLDPSLPDLQRTLDPVNVSRQFERSWGTRPRASSVRECALEYLHWSPGACVATYRLTREPSSLQPAAVFGFVTVGPDGINHRLYTEDPDLQGLAAAANPTAMRPWLAERLGRRIDACTVTPVRYRPGRRCVLRYELSDRIGTVLYGKVLAGEQSTQLATTIASLGGRFVAQLAGAAPEWQLVVQTDAGARNLGSITSSRPSVTEFAELYAGGALLARLHARSSPPGDHRSLLADARELRQYLPACERFAPETAALIDAGIQRIIALDDQVGSMGPSHGAFRLDQVHVGSAMPPLLIDLDSYCWSEPARDIGNLLAYLRWREIRRPASASVIADVCETLLAGYASAACAPLDQRRVRAFESTSLLKIAGRRYPRLKVEQWERVPHLIDAAFRLLDTNAGTAP